MRNPSNERDAIKMLRARKLELVGVNFSIDTYQNRQAELQEEITELESYIQAEVARLTGQGPPSPDSAELQKELDELEHTSEIAKAISSSNMAKEVKDELLNNLKSS